MEIFSWQNILQKYTTTQKTAKGRYNAPLCLILLNKKARVYSGFKMIGLEN